VDRVGRHPGRFGEHSVVALEHPALACVREAGTIARFVTDSPHFGGIASMAKQAEYVAR
jgi:hypothetical protein